MKKKRLQMGNDINISRLEKSTCSSEALYFVPLKDPPWPKPAKIEERII